MIPFLFLCFEFLLFIFEFLVTVQVCDATKVSFLYCSPAHKKITTQNSKHKTIPHATQQPEILMQPVFRDTTHK